MYWLNCVKCKIYSINKLTLKSDLLKYVETEGTFTIQI